MRYLLNVVPVALLLVVSAAPSSVPRSRHAFPQDSSGLPNPSAIVKPHTYISLEPTPRGKVFQAAVVVEIARGFHMNSHQPSESYLIPTTLTAEIPAGIKLIDTIYPPGKLEKFAFSPTKPLDVYTGSVTLRLRLALTSDAPIGTMTIPAKLRYQACNDVACLRPVTVPVNIQLKVAEAGAKSQAAHADIFAAENSSSPE
jgi:DsbC/DsbD-like thiol-disulfide interchange protein